MAQWYNNPEGKKLPREGRIAFCLQSRMDPVTNYLHFLVCVPVRGKSWKEKI